MTTHAPGPQVEAKKKTWLDVPGFPKAKVVAGYQPVMPTFRGQVTEEQILALIAYIKSLSPNVAVPERSTK